MKRLHIWRIHPYIDEQRVTYCGSAPASDKSTIGIWDTEFEKIKTNHVGDYELILSHFCKKCVERYNEVQNS
jgi:hypothetical protein